MRPMFIATLLFSSGDQMVGLFLPLFLFGIGRELEIKLSFGLTPFTSGVLFVVLYYLLQRLVVLLTAFPLGKLIGKLGYVGSMGVGTLLLCANYLGFYLAQSRPVFLILSFVCGGMSMVLYWVAHDSLFSQIAKPGQIGRDVGAITFLTKIVRVITPALGGILIVYFGYQTFFIFGLGVVILSLLPYFFIPHLKVQSMPSIRQFGTWFKEARFRKFALVQAGIYMDIVAVILWPIYVMLSVGAIERVGFIFSLVIFVSLVLTYLAGWLIDRRLGVKFFILSGLVVSVSWLLRLFVRGAWDIVGVELVDKLGASMYKPCYDSFLLRRSKGKDVVPFFVYKEVLLSISAIILWSMAGLLFLLPSPWTGVFILGSLGILLSLFLDGF